MAKRKTGLKEPFYLGLGIAAMVKDRIETVMKSLVKEGKLTGKNQKELRKKLAKQGEREYRMLMNAYEKSTNSALKALNIPTRAEFEALKKKVHKKR